MKDLSAPSLLNPVLIAGSLILLISFAIRSTFGLFQIPIAEDFLWARSEFSLAIAVQNLAWGIGTPLFSAFAEKYGDRKAISIGLILYALGVFISSTASSPEAHQFLNILIGFGIAGSGFGPILAVVGRAASDEKRSIALGITTAAGSAGQVIGPPFAAILLSIMPWTSVFEIFAIISILTIALVPFLKTKSHINIKVSDSTLGDALKEAIQDPTYLMLFLGFFSCGFQLAFITAHFPAFIAESSSPIIQGSIISLVCNSVEGLGALSMALIGFFRLCKKILVISHLYRKNNCSYSFYHITNNTNVRCYIFNSDGFFMACYSALNIWHNWTYLWNKIYGNTLWYCIFISSNWIFCWSLVRWTIL
jgi:MFS family permease